MKPSTYNSHETTRMAELHGAPLASFTRRAIAFLLDLGFAAALFAAVGSLLEPFLIARGWIKSGDEIVFALNLNWYSIAWSVLYYGLATYFGRGRTPGKILLGIRVVSLVHQRISLWHSLERALGYGASLLEFGFGFVQYFIHPNKRTVHDRIAETIVIRDSKRGRLILAGLLAILGCGVNEPAPIHVVGAMKNVMLGGELFSTIALDTIAEREHLYGLGPLENLAGEILIVDGISYVARIDHDSTMRVEKRFDVKAPFLVYGRVDRWERQRLPESVHTLRQLETYVDRTTQTRKRPFAFRLSGLTKTATIHVVNLPRGSQVHSPEDAHQGQRNFSFKNKQVEIIGFFSTSHQGIFTHHDSFIHAHLLTDDKSAMGHLDEVEFAEGQMELYLPAS